MTSIARSNALIEATAFEVERKSTNSIRILPSSSPTAMKWNKALFKEVWNVLLYKSEATAAPMRFFLCLLLISPIKCSQHHVSLLLVLKAESSSQTIETKTGISDEDGTYQEVENSSFHKAASSISPAKRNLIMCKARNINFNRKLKTPICFDSWFSILGSRCIYNHIFLHTNNPTIVSMTT